MGLEVVVELDGNGGDNEGDNCEGGGMTAAVVGGGRSGEISTSAFTYREVENHLRELRALCIESWSWSGNR